MAFEDANYIGRRQLLQAATVSAILPATTAAQSPPASSRNVGWTRLIGEVRAMARQLFIEEGRSPSGYVRFLASEGYGLIDVPEVALKPIPWMQPAMSFAMLSIGSPFAINRWRMEPGARQPAHTHPNASVCTVLLSGELTMENFEFEGSIPEQTASSFELRRTRVELLSAGRTSVLAPSENNIHRLTAGSAGASGIDINTMHGPASRFGYIDLSPTNITDRFTGKWFDPSRSAA